MPLLNGAFASLLSGGPSAKGLGSATAELSLAGERAGTPAAGRLLETCANPGCDSGWLHLWRGRAVPVFEAGWTCSAGCTRARIAKAVRRELEGRSSLRESRHHRVPLGLLMLEQGWITQDQLRHALNAQKAAGSGRLGSWLIREQGIDEQLVVRALGLQWSCPVLTLEFHDPEAMTVTMPRLFVDAFGVLPVRVAAGKLLYLGFEDRIDPVLALAIERITGLQAECGLVRPSQFREAHERALNAEFPAAELVDAGSEPAAIHAITRAVERVRPVESRLVRVHDCLWLRMWLRPKRGLQPEHSGIYDVICSVGRQ